MIKALNAGQSTANWGYENRFAIMSLLRSTEWLRANGLRILHGEHRGGLNILEALQWRSTNLAAISEFGCRPCG